jgi:Endonuclease/Exonuclease/phosphatase family
LTRTYHIAGWNLENLFDEENAVALGRRDKAFRAIKNDIAGWTPQLRDRKIDQLAPVIPAMNTGQGPDLLGVCEVENRFVIDRLVNGVNAILPRPRNDAVVHADTDDDRGIDVASIYDNTLFQLPRCRSRSRCSSTS